MQNLVTLLQTLAFLVVFIAGVFSGYIDSERRTTDKFQKSAIEANVAYYDSKTKEFKFKEIK